MNPLPANYSPSFLERNQRDIAARLAAHAPFANVHVFLVRPREKESFAQIAERVQQANAGVLKKNGKAGLTLSVLMPLADADKAGAANPTLRLTYTVRVQELVPVNMGPGGTRISAEDAALEALSVLHNFQPGPANALFPAAELLTPADSDDALITYDLKLQQIYAARRAVRSPLPLITVADGLVTLSGLDFALRYTLDGSYPSALNPAAQLYAEPFAAPAPGTLLRVVAEKADHQQSDIREHRF